MSKMIYVEEDHNLNAIKNIADAVDGNDATTLQQVNTLIIEADSTLTAGLGIDITDDVVSVKTDPLGSLSLDNKGLSVDVADGIGKTADTGALFVNVGDGLHFAGANEDFVTVKTNPLGSITVDDTGISVDVADGIGKSPDNGALLVNVGDGLHLAGDNADFVTVKAEDGSISVLPTGITVNVGKGIVKAPVVGDIGVNVDDVSVKIVDDKVTVDPTWLADQIDVATEALTAGNGIDITDSVVSVVPEDGSISVLSTGITVNVGRGIIKTPDVGDISVNTGDGLAIRDDKVTVKSEDGSISVLSTGLAVNVGKGIVKAPVVGDIGVNVDDISVKIVDDKVTVDPTWLAGQIDTNTADLTAGLGIDITDDVVSVKTDPLGSLSLDNKGLSVDVADGIGKTADTGALFVNLGNGLYFAGNNADFVTVQTSANSGISVGPEGIAVDTADGIGHNNDNGSLYVILGDGLHFAGDNADFVTVNPKAGGHVGVDPAGVFVDVTTLANDPAFIEATQTMVGGEPDYQFESPTPGATYPLRPTLYFRGRAVGVLDDPTNDQTIIDVLEEMPRGGTTGQVLGKTTDEDWIVGWVNPTTVAGTAPITVVDDGAGSNLIGVATGPGITIANSKVEADVDPAGGLTKTAGAGNSLAVVAPAGEGIIVDATGVSVDWGVVPAPEGDSDAANKAYVDQVAQGMIPLAAARAATVGASIALDGTVTSLDGVNLVAGDRVLVKDQTNPVENGVYDVVAGAAWTRSADTDTEGDLRVGSTVFVSEGATNANASFAVASIEVALPGTQSVWTPDTDPTVWVKSSQISGYVGGDGIDVTGNNISVTAGNGIAIVTDAVTVKPADGSINVDADGIKAKVQPNGGLMETAQGPAVNLDVDSGLYVDPLDGVLRAEVGVQTAIATITTSVDVLPTQTINVDHGLGVANPTVTVQDVNGCTVTTGICRSDNNSVGIHFDKVPPNTTFTVIVTG